MDEQGEEIGDRTNGTQGNDANDPDDRERIYEQVSIIVQSYISLYFMILKTLHLHMINLENFSSGKWKQTK